MSNLTLEEAETLLVKLWNDGSSVTPQFVQVGERAFETVLNEEKKRKELFSPKGLTMLFPALGKKKC